MKNILKNNFVWMVIGMAICGGTVLASNYIASDIVYTPSDSSWKVSNVAEAINSIELSKVSTNYSTEERVVGTWVDGKPLYQKTVTKASIASSGNWVIVEPYDSTREYKNIFGYALGTDSKGKINFPMPQAIYGDYIAAILDGANGVAVMCQRNGTTFDVSVTMQYTKTTDQALNS